MATSTASDLLNLSTLPPDLIRNIIRDKRVLLKNVALVSRILICIDQEQENFALQISKSWNFLAREYRNQFPVLEKLSISYEWGAFCISLIVASNVSEYLKIHLRSQNYNFKECPQTDGVSFFFLIFSKLYSHLFRRSLSKYKCQPLQAD